LTDHKQLSVYFQYSKYIHILAPFPRYSELLVKITKLFLLHVYLAPKLDFKQDPCHQKTKLQSLCYHVALCWYACSVSIQNYGQRDNSGHRMYCTSRRSHGKNCKCVLNHFF